MVNSLRKVDFSHPTGHYMYMEIIPPFRKSWVRPWIRNRIRGETRGERDGETERQTERRLETHAICKDLASYQMTIITPPFVPLPQHTLPMTRVRSAAQQCAVTRDDPAVTCGDPVSLTRGGSPLRHHAVYRDGRRFRLGTGSSYYGRPIMTWVLITEYSAAAITRL